MNDSNSANKKFQRELKSGTVSLVLLSILDRAGRPMYGYQIMKHIGEEQEEGSWIKQGTLYPVLRSLEKSGFLESDVEPSSSGPPRRYYEITGQGRQSLAEWKETWKRTKDFVDSILKGNYDV